MKNILRLTTLAIVVLISINGTSNIFNKKQTLDFENDILNDEPKAKAESGISLNIDYNYIGSYYKTTKDESYTYKTIKWTDYAKDWTSFRRSYSTFTLSGMMLGGFEGWSTIKSNNLGSDYTYKLSASNNAFQIINWISNSLYTHLFLRLWKDGENISFKWEAFLKGKIKNVIAIKVEKITFYKKNNNL